MKPELQAYIDEIIRKNGGVMPLKDEMNKHLGKFFEQQNNRPIEDFDGLSPNEMSRLRGFPFSDRSPVQFMQLPAEEYENIPIFRQAKYLLNAIESGNGLKLTDKGNLPTKVVKEMYLLGAREYMLENHPYTTIKESDSTSVMTAKALLGEAGIIKKLHNKLQLTNKGKKIVADNHKLLMELLTTYCQRFNWSSFDGYDLPDIGVDGWALSLVLIGKYGEKPKDEHFYAEKYFKAFPLLLEGIVGFDESLEKCYGSVENYCAKAYCLRTFTHFMKPFGFVTIENESLFDREATVKKTPLFDKFVHLNSLFAV